MITLVSFLTSFTITCLLVPVLRKLALRLDIVDLPGGRKMHQGAIPLAGGAALSLGFLAGLFINLQSMRFFIPIVLGSSIILVVGIIDDKRGLSAQVRLLCQLIAATIVIMSGIRISFLPPTLWGDTIEVFITLIWIIGVTNAYNYLDGLDGLAAGSAAINLLCFAAILYTTNQFPLGILSFVLMGSCLAFLPYNFRRQKTFLGDAGSTFIGFILAGIALQGSWAADDMVKLLIPVLILGVPIFDMIFTTVMRIRTDKIKTVIDWLRYGGKDHFHHYLVDMGLMPLGAVIFIYFVTLSLGISAIMVSNDKSVEALLTLMQASITFGIIATLIVVGKRRRSGWQRVNRENP